jgi:MtrB/PioB family decaheme-associated outer membrane protein
MPMRDWEYALNVRHETREGTKRSAGAFFINAAQLIEPVDHVTDQIDASASYTGGRLQAKFAYHGSLFSNNNQALTWQNPFSPIVGGDNNGQLALPPDNQFHQLSASAGYQFTPGTRASADIAFGRMTQNEAFLANSLTARFVQALPQASLNGRADTLNASLKLSSALTERLRLNALVSHDERDNKTPQAVYPVVATDMFPGLARTNLPYGFKNDKGRLSADFRVSGATSASAGLDSESRKRTFQEVERTRENTVWGRVKSRVLDNVDVSFRLAHGERRISSYQAVPGISFPVNTLPENPLLRKFNMADRTRNSAGLRADIAATDSVNIGFGVESSKDAYLNSPIGLINGRDFSVNADLSARLTEQTSVQLFANQQRIKSQQAGSQTFSTPNWTGENADTINVAGVGLKHAAIPDKLDLGADYALSRSKSAITVNTGANDPVFPALRASLTSLKLYATYRLRDNMSLNAGYWHQLYKSTNWMLDGVAPNTIPNVLTFGEESPRYNVNLVNLSLRYKF